MDSTTFPIFRLLVSGPVKRYLITNEVIAGLNKAYKPAAPAKEVKAEAKKK